MKHPWDWVRFMLNQKEVAAVEAWYAEEIRKAKEEAWKEARAEVRNLPHWYNPKTGKGGFDLQPLGPDESSEDGAFDAVFEILDANPYRKDHT